MSFDEGKSKDVFYRFLTVDSDGAEFNEAEADFWCGPQDALRNDSYDSIKDRLIVRVYNKEYLETNGGILDSVPHRNYLDLVMTYHILDGDAEEGLVYIVDNDMLATFGISEEVLHKDAIANSERILPMVVGGTCQFIPNDNTPAGPFMIASNKLCYYGAATIFYEGALETLFGGIGPMFLIPSSVHEVLILKDDGQFGTTFLAEMHIEINGTCVREEERLSNHVYHYDGVTLEIAD